MQKAKEEAEKKLIEINHEDIKSFIKEVITYLTNQEKTLDGEIVNEEGEQQKQEGEEDYSSNAESKGLLLKNGGPKVFNLKDVTNQEKTPDEEVVNSLTNLENIPVKKEEVKFDIHE